MASHIVLPKSEVQVVHENFSFLVEENKPSLCPSQKVSLVQYNMDNHLVLQD